MDALSRYYATLYGLGLRPWEEDANEGATAEQVAALLDREEACRRAPFGPALDLGCGTGIWSVKLAQRGWRITGVDVVPRAVRAARERAAAADVDARFVEADVTRLDAAALGEGFDFVLDIECFNHLSDERRSAVGRGVTAVVKPGATMLMLVWSPGRRWFLPPGASLAQIEQAYPEWRVVESEPYAARASLPWWLRRIDLTYVRLRHGGAA